MHISSHPCQSSPTPTPPLHTHQEQSPDRGSYRLLLWGKLITRAAPWGPSWLFPGSWEVAQQARPYPPWQLSVRRHCSFSLGWCAPHSGVCTEGRESVWQAVERSLHTVTKLNTSKASSRFTNLLVSQCSVTQIEAPQVGEAQDLGTPHLEPPSPHPHPTSNLSVLVSPPSK